MPKEKDMLKCFLSLPVEFEQYNPNLLRLEDFPTSETRDEQNLLHSFNDKPAMIFKHNKAETEFSWFSHGKSFRPNKPATIFISENRRYSTHDENGHLHSYDGQPAEIYYSPVTGRLELTWSNHGKHHRENDLPALITWFDHNASSPTPVVETIYYVNGEKHRENELPAYISEDNKIWFVHGSWHNTKGKAAIDLKEPNRLDGRRWGLYGIEMNQKTFNTIIAYSKKRQVPVWVATLCVLRVVDVKEIKFFKNDAGKWEPNLPVAWVLHAWGVTEQIFMKRMYDDNRIDIVLKYDGRLAISQLDHFMKVVKFEETFLARQELRNEVSHA